MDLEKLLKGPIFIKRKMLNNIWHYYLISLNNFSLLNNDYIEFVFDDKKVSCILNNGNYIFSKNVSDDDILNILKYIKSRS